MPTFIGENQVEALQPAGPAHRGLPGHRRLRRRHHAGGQRRRAAARRRPHPSKARSSSRRSDIPLSTKVQADQITVQMLPLVVDPAGRLHGRVAGHRQGRAPGRDQRRADHRRHVRPEPGGSILDIETPPGLRSIAVEVDQVTGVGTVIKTGDYVDMVVGFASDKFPVVTQNPVDDSFQVVAGLNGTSVKLLLQGMQVLGTLLPPPDDRDRTRTPAPQPGTALNDQREIVILAVTPQQVGSHQVRPAGRIHLPGPPLPRRLHRSGDRRGHPRRRPEHHHRRHPQDARRVLRRPAAGTRRDGHPLATDGRPASRRPTDDPGRGSARTHPVRTVAATPGPVIRPSPTPNT